VSLDDLREYLEDFAWFWPGVLVSLALGIVLGRWLGRALRVPRAVATLLILGAGLIASATVTPSREALTQGAVGSGTCEIARVGPTSIAELLSFGDPTYNVLLFMPLGLAIGLIPASRRMAVLVVAAVILPFAIETIQLLATGLGRACQSSDIADNLTGLVIGLVIGVVARRLSARPGRPRRSAR
jgi:peptidoglycan/LPS O-acetylase OafA/YrhL